MQRALDDILANGVRGDADVGVIATRGTNQLAVRVWHYHDDDVAGPDAAVRLELRGLPRGFTRPEHLRIDRDHGNAYAAWQRMGSPISIEKSDWDALRAAGRLTALRERADVALEAGTATLNFDLPRQGVSLLLIGTNLPASL